MEGPFSEDDELFLFETFAKITNKESQTDCMFSEDDDDIPFEEFFLFEKDDEPRQSESPIDIIPSPDSPSQFLLATFSDQSQGSPSPCQSPISLFPPVHLDNIFTPCTPPPSLSPTSPTVDCPAELNSPSVEREDYFTPSPDTPTPSDADFARVHFIDLKDLYEKTQVRRRGISEQRLVDCHVHMFSHFTSTLYNIEVYVCRHPETDDLEDKMQLPVALQKTLPDTQYFSVNLDSVYNTTLGNPFYHLSTTHRLRKNRFIIDVTLTFTDESRANFKSEPFLVRSRKQSPNPRKKRSNTR